MCCFGLLGRSLAYALVDLVRTSTIEIQLHKLGTCMVVWRIAEYNLWTRRDVSIGLFRSAGVQKTLFRVNPQSITRSACMSVHKTFWQMYCYQNR